MILPLCAPMVNITDVYSLGEEDRRISILKYLEVCLLPEDKNKTGIIKKKTT